MCARSGLWTRENLLLPQARTCRDFLSGNPAAYGIRWVTVTNRRCSPASTLFEPHTHVRSRTLDFLFSQFQPAQRLFRGCSAPDRTSKPPCCHASVIRAGCPMLDVSHFLAEAVTDHAYPPIYISYYHPHGCTLPMPFERKASARLELPPTLNWGFHAAFLHASAVVIPFMITTRS